MRKIREENKQSLEKQSEKIKTLVENCGVSQEELNQISSLGWEDLVSKLKSGELTATVVLRAYQAACLDIHNRNSDLCWRNVKTEKNDQSMLSALILCLKSYPI